MSKDNENQEFSDGLRDERKFISIRCSMYDLTAMNGNEMNMLEISLLAPHRNEKNFVFPIITFRKEIGVIS